MAVVAVAVAVVAKTKRQNGMREEAPRHKKRDAGPKRKWKNLEGAQCAKWPNGRGRRRQGARMQEWKKGRSFRVFRIGGAPAPPQNHTGLRAQNFLHFCLLSVYRPGRPSFGPKRSEHDVYSARAPSFSTASTSSSWQNLQRAPWQEKKNEL